MIRPKQLIVETTSRCNLQCKYCPNVTNGGKFPTGDIDIDFFKSIIDTAAEEFPDTIIIPWMNGEALLHPKYPEMVQYLNEKKRRFYVTTNGTVWREDVFKELFREGSGAYQLIISLDGLFGTGSIAKARPGSDENIIKSNISRIFHLHREMASKTDLAVKICERGQDHQEIEDYLKFWLHDPDINYVCVGKALKDENPVSMRLHPCQYFDRNFMVVRFDGTLVPCAYNDHVVNEGMLKYGKLNKGDSLIEAYNNDFISRLREEQNVGIFRSPCDKCSFAYTGTGIHGKIEFVSDPGESYWYRADYYNTMYSREQKWKSNSYYQGGKDGPCDIR